MTTIAADLHVHTSASPCASRAMTPAAIAAECARRGLGLIAVCDHNTAAAAQPVMDAASAVEDGPVVIAGIEITTREEAHVLGWFPSAEDAGAAAAELEVDPALESAAADCTLSQAVDLIHRHGGLAAAAHVDRRSFSVPGQLGFIPADVPFDALEISAAGAERGRAAAFTAHGLPLVSSSDSHCLEDLGSGCTLLDVEAPGFDELARALGRREGRGCVIA
ncbi:MAG TPA: PHP-associated domain-containing protein [Spirochaetia bacterium]|nr:PHP-associated domain-containing protein [Spirochaetia bacterium]